MVRKQIVQSLTRSLAAVGVAALVLTAGQAMAGSNPFADGSALPQIAQAETGKCGGEMADKAKEKAKAKMQCGDGKCGAAMEKAKEAAPEKCAAGKCDSGKCGNAPKEAAPEKCAAGKSAPSKCGGK